MPDPIAETPPISAHFSRAGVLAIGLFLAVGILAQVVVPTGSDVSWLIVVAEKVFDGQRLYVDVIESNPPMAIFLYMPAVLVERLTGIRAETAEIALTSMGALGCLWLSARILREAGLAKTIEPFVVAGAFALLVLPRLAFSEREHFAVMLMLPVLVTAAARASAARVAPSLALAAGLAAGIGAAIKPQFVLAMLVPAIYPVARARSLRPILGVENWIAAGIVAAFVGFVLIAYPAYVSSVVPMEAETYVYLRHPLVDLLMDTLFLSMVGVGLVILFGRRDGPEPLAIVLLLAATGFAMAYLLQGKGWRYQLYPALALVSILVGTEVLPLFGLIRDRKGAGFRRYLRLAAASAALVGVVAFLLLGNFAYTVSLPLVPEIEAVAPHARVFALSTDLGVGHPLSRAVGGTWVGSVCSQLITRMAKYRRDLPDTDAVTRGRMAHWIDWDRDRIAEALRDGRPDVIVYDRATFDWSELVTARPDIGAMLTIYTKTAEVDGVDLLVRQDLVAGRQSAELSHARSR